MNADRTENERCCPCTDDEAYKYCECFCLCHTRTHQSTADECRQCGPREIALGRCLCMKKVYANG